MHRILQETQIEIDIRSRDSMLRLSFHARKKMSRKNPAHLKGRKLLIYNIITVC